MAALGAALSLALLPIPFIGPFLAGAVAVIVAAIGVAGLTGFLGTIITPFVSGLRFNIYKQPKTFPALPASGRQFLFTCSRTHWTQGSSDDRSCSLTGPKAYQLMV